MNTVDLCVFLTSYTLVVAFAAVGEFLWRRKASLLLTAVIALVAVGATTAVGFYLEPGKSYLQILRDLASQRDFSTAASLAMGLAAGLVWITRSTDRTRTTGNDQRTILRNVTPLILVASIIGVVLCGQAFIWKGILGVQRDPAVRMHAPEFVIQKVADLDFLPLRVAASDQGKIYVNYDYFEKWGTMGGTIIELAPDATTGEFHQKTVADSTLLMRSYGLVARDGDLFISRTGIWPQATQGKVAYENAGAVTRLRDLDGDGYFEFAHDIVTGLPGARGPDTMQQNNGICFAADGSLFVTTASAGNRVLDEHPWAGAILRVSPNFSRTEVFAKGFRNPFGIVIGPEDELFVTDNDIDENPGDEINHVVRDAHYGHPYVVPHEASVEPSGFRDPIYLSGLESNLLGMAYATSSALPEEYRNCIYVADYMEHQITRVKLVRSGDTFQVSGTYPFATITTPVDIAVTPSGEFFVVSRRTQNVYQIRLRQKATESSNE